MSDTREFYLICNDGVIFGSDPKTQYKYLDMSDESSLNEKASSVIYNFKNQFRVISDYEIELTLTFNNRDERELFAMTNIDKIWAFGATGKVDKSVIYTKRAMVAGFEFLDNDYTNGIQSVLTLKVSGQWQSDLTQYIVPAADDNKDGTKKYYAGSLYETAMNSAVGANLLTGTSNDEQSYTFNSSSNSNGINDTPNQGLGFAHGDLEVGQAYIYRVYIKNAPTDVKPQIALWDNNSNLLAVFTGNIITTGNSGYSTCTFTIPNNTYYSNFSVIRSDNSMNANTDYIFNWKEEKLEKGSTATPWVPSKSDGYYDYLCSATYRYSLPTENLNVYKYGSTNYSNQIQLDIEDNQFMIYFLLNEGENQVVIANDTQSVTLKHTAFNNGELVPLGSEGIDYSLDSRDTIDAFSLWKDGTLLSDDWTVDSVNDYFTLLSILDSIKSEPVSIIATGEQGATLPYTIYTYSKHDFI